MVGRMCVLEAVCAILSSMGVTEGQGGQNSQLWRTSLRKSSGKGQSWMCAFRVEVSTFFLESVDSGQHLDSEATLVPKCVRRVEERMPFFDFFRGFDSLGSDPWPQTLSCLMM